MVYVAACSGKLFALQRGDGNPSWTYDITADGDQSGFHSVPIITDRLLVIGTDGAGVGHVYAFDRKTGEVRWKYLIDEPALGPNESFGVAGDLVRFGDRVIAQTSAYRIVSLELSTGRLAWEFVMPARAAMPPRPVSPALAAGRVMAASADGVVYAIDAASGNELWQTDVGAALSSGIAAEADHVYVGTSADKVLRLSLADGRIVASSASPGTPRWNPIVAGGSVVFVVNPNTIVAWDLDLRQQRWSAKTASEWSSPNFLAWRDALVAANGLGEVLVFDPKSGNELWKAKLRGYLRSVSAADDLLFVGNTDGDVFAFTPPQTSSIKALSEEHIQGLREGKGMGLALAAELNNYPGPKHVLELAERLQLTPEQHKKVRAIHDAMLEAAVQVGREIIDLEQRLDGAFAGGAIDSKLLAELTDAIAERQGKLRFVHLDAHLATRAALTAKQIEAYDQARGYRHQRGGHRRH